MSKADKKQPTRERGKRHRTYSTSDDEDFSSRPFKIQEDYIPTERAKNLRQRKTVKYCE